MSVDKILEFVFETPGKATLLGLGLLTAVCLGGCHVANNWKYSEGDRVGMLNKVSKKGAIWETYECQMALEGISGSGESLGANVRNFAIDNYLPKGEQQKLSEELQAYMSSGQKVKIHYVEMLKTLPWRSGSDNLFRSIESVAIAGRNDQSPVVEQNNRLPNANSNEIYLD